MIQRSSQMVCLLLCAGTWSGLQCRAAQSAEPLAAASQRFAASVDEVPDFRRHVVPLLGRQGCNGRACHGSFQGQGGFRLSLFGYDFAADHEALAGGDTPRVNRADPKNSLMLQKPTLAVDHGGEKRIEPDSWQYRLLLRWIEGGAKEYPDGAAELAHLEVTPAEIMFHSPGEQRPLTVVAHWEDGSREDVTCLCRFRTNDDSVATVDETGSVTAAGRGDTHIVVFYDNGVLPVNVAMPVSDLVGPRYPAVPAPTRVDQLVIDKLRKLGIVPSQLASDAEFLRRVSLDITGTLPKSEEVVAFQSDARADKRARKIDELLERPGYAAWWSTKLCDFTGNSAGQLNQTGLSAQDSSREWYQWILQRVSQNTPYDELVAGIVLSRGRQPDQDFEGYCRESSSYYMPQGDAEFADRATMPHFWSRRNVRTPEEKALAFAYSFLGVHIQCAQCHKHPFDQWTKQDFDQFKAFFTRVNYGIAPDARSAYTALQKDLGLADKKGNELRRELPAKLKEGKVVPWQEVFIRPADRAMREEKKKKAEGKPAKAPPPMMAKLLGSDVVELTETDDPREPLMNWLRNDAERYFARSFVNRVWAAYFGVGIVEPADDLNMANPPSNPELLDHLTHGFVEHGFDMKWLHREIANSRTYQLGWQTNETNLHDQRNFSHATSRRLPAEVAYDALLCATAGSQEWDALEHEFSRRAIGTYAVDGRGRGRQNQYVLTVFGRPTRETNCDCERSAEPSLLQTVYLRNDQEMLTLLNRPEGWLREIARVVDGSAQNTNEAEDAVAARIKELEEKIARVKRKGSSQRVAMLEQLLDAVRRRSSVEEPITGPLAAALSSTSKQSIDHWRTNEAGVIREAYLRTLSRQPTAEERARVERYLAESPDKLAGLRDVLWALLNTKEFIVNH